MRTKVVAHLRRGLVRGLLLVLPLLITVWLLGILFNLVDTYITPHVMGVLRWARIPGLDRWFARELLVPVIGVVLTGVLIYLLGLMAGNLLGRRILGAIERAILRIPVVKGIYGSARQLLNAFTLTGKRTFSKVVMVEYPRRGLWTVGFVTREVEHRIAAAPPRPPASVVPVFLPTTPNPTSGWMLLVPHEDLLVLDMTIEEGIKLIVSGGIVGPENLGSVSRPWPRDSETAAQEL